MNRNRLIQLTILTILLFSFGTSFAQSGGTISYGETVNGTITDDDPVQSWTFEGSTGDVVTISMEAVDFADGGLDSYLQLLDSNGTVIAENDDASNVTINAEIAGFMLPADGSYTIHATRFGLETGLAVGEYSLTLTLVSGESDANATPAPGGEQSISTDQEVAGTINRSNFEDRWTFEGNAGDVISVRMSRISDSSDLDSYLQILDNENRELTQNDDSPEGIAVSEILNFELPYTGTYIIVATRYGFESGTSSGDYVLVITEGEAGTTPAEDSTPEPTETPEAESTPEPVETEQPQVEVEAIPISYGDSVSGSSPGSGVAIYTFEGTAGDVV
ncbi:MAG TPA: DVUA0089 family protein, partial [Aggregatilineales bacterium]|nr:DVUA0089 family protein [Aggregatilineales bacterium]